MATMISKTTQSISASFQALPLHCHKHGRSTDATQASKLLGQLGTSHPDLIPETPVLSSTILAWTVTWTHSASHISKLLCAFWTLIPRLLSTWEIYTHPSKTYLGVGVGGCVEIFPLLSTAFYYLAVTGCFTQGLHFVFPGRAPVLLLSTP